MVLFLVLILIYIIVDRSFYLKLFQLHKLHSCRLQMRLILVINEQIWWILLGCLQSVVSERQQPVDFGRNDMAPQVRPRISLLTSMPSTPDYLSGIPRNRIQQWVFDLCAAVMIINKQPFLNGYRPTIKAKVLKWLDQNLRSVRYSEIAG